MRLWTPHPDRVVDVDKLLGLEVHHNGDSVSPNHWQLVGVNAGSYVLLLEGTEAQVRAGLAEGIGVMAGTRAPIGVHWRGPADDDPRRGLPLKGVG